MFSLLVPMEPMPSLCEVEFLMHWYHWQKPWPVLIPKVKLWSKRRSSKKNVPYCLLVPQVSKKEKIMDFFNILYAAAPFFHHVTNTMHRFRGSVPLTDTHSWFLSQLCSCSRAPMHATARNSFLKNVNKIELECCWCWWDMHVSVKS